jgi:hypothetical protein
MFIGYVFGRYDNPDIEDIELKQLCKEWIDKFDLDIDEIALRNSYYVAIQVFKDCLKEQKK